MDAAGGVDILVNYAGVMAFFNIVEGYPLDEQMKEINIDAVGPIRMIQHFLPSMLQRESTIINVSSGLAYVPFAETQTLMADCHRASNCPVPDNFRISHAREPAPAGCALHASAMSAYGFYDHEHPPFTEQDRERRTGTNFLQQLIDDWEVAALEAEAAGNAVVLLRIGVVLDRSGGALPSMALPFKFLMGGPVGSGAQVMSWISVGDLVNGIHFLIENPKITGSVNLVSPGACNQRAFAIALGRALGRPNLVPTPSFMIRALMGQMGQELVLTGQRVVPHRLQEAGFTFQDTDIEVFLRTLFKR
ncbi:MAG: SDR family NAD(P)-dependent oxidoreductase [Sumerlaeia bacterium]